MNTRHLMLSFVLPLVLAGAGAAQIPQPDGMVFGTLKVDAAPVGIASHVSVLARVNGFEEPVAVYHVGDLPAAGSRFVLQIPHQLQTDGRTPSTQTPRTGVEARIYVREGDGPEVFAARTNVPPPGQAVELSLNVASDDLAPNRVLPGTGAACGSGGGLCGAFGFSSLAFMLCGLGALKASVRRGPRRGRAVS